MPGSFAPPARRCHFPKVPDLDRLEQLQSNTVVLLSPKTLKDLGEDEIAHQDELLSQKRVQRVRLRGDPPVEIINPNGAIGQYHGRPAWLRDRPPKESCRDSFGSLPAT